MLCTMTRWMIDRCLDGRQILPGFVPRHIERCSRCRQYLAASRQLLEELSSPGEETAPPPAGLRTRVLERIAEQSSASRPAGGGQFAGGNRLLRQGLLAVLAAAAALAGLAILWALLPVGGRPTTPPAPPAQTAVALPTIRPAVAVRQSSQAVEELAGQMAGRQLGVFYDEAMAAGHLLLASLPIDVAEWAGDAAPRPPDQPNR